MSSRAGPRVFEQRLVGVGLHSGRKCAVTVSQAAGPVLFETPRGTRRLDEVTISRADQGVEIAAPDIGLRIDLVEHLLAALGGLSIRRDIRIRVDGGEVPLLDGGAVELASALARLHLPRSAPSLEVRRQARFVVGDSAYELFPATRVELDVTVDFAARGLGIEHASWDGDAIDFHQRIAPARTFGFLSDADGLRQRGRAAGTGTHQDAVLVFDARGSQVLGVRPRQEGELARHKLLDLIGDLYLFGGPPLGRVSCSRPGHNASHEMFRRALDSGVVASVEAR